MRVFLGPSSIAGVEWEYRQGLRKLGVDARVILNTPHRFDYSYDYVFSQGRFSSISVARKLPSLLRHYDVFHFSFGSSLLPFKLDVPILKKLKKGIVMTFLGSDIRCNKLVLEGFVEPETCNYCKQRPCRIKQKKRLVNFWGRNADAIFSGVEMSAMLDYYRIPYNIIVLPIDLDHWKPFESSIEWRTKDDEVLVVHAPSSSAIKGTPIIVDAINRLKRKYPIKFKVLVDMPNNVVREWLNAADIVIDQISMGGGGGKLSIESMALAKPTLSYTREEFKAKHLFLKESPKVNITQENLYHQLETLIIDEKKRVNLGKLSRNHVEKYHDGRIVCRNLLKTYEKILEK